MLFERFVTQSPEPVDQLRAACRAYVARFERIAEADALLDPEDAREIGALCEALLDHLGDEPDPAAHTLVHAAVRYFVLEDDGDADTSIGGLEDDRAVVRAVAIALGRADLVRRR